MRHCPDLNQGPDGKPNYKPKDDLEMRHCPDQPGISCLLDRRFNHYATEPRVNMYHG